MASVRRLQSFKSQKGQGVPPLTEPGVSSPNKRSRQVKRPAELGDDSRNETSHVSVPLSPALRSKLRQPGAGTRGGSKTTTVNANPGGGSGIRGNGTVNANSGSNKPSESGSRSSSGLQKKRLPSKPTSHDPNRDDAIIGDLLAWVDNSVDDDHDHADSTPEDDDHVADEDGLDVDGGPVKSGRSAKSFFARLNADDGGDKDADDDADDNPAASTRKTSDMNSTVVRQKTQSRTIFDCRKSVRDDLDKEEGNDDISADVPPPRFLTHSPNRSPSRTLNRSPNRSPSRLRRGSEISVSSRDKEPSEIPSPRKPPQHQVQPTFQYSGFDATVEEKAIVAPIKKFRQIVGGGNQSTIGGIGSTRSGARAKTGAAGGGGIVLFSLELPFPNSQRGGSSSENSSVASTPMDDGPKSTANPHKSNKLEVNFSLKIFQDYPHSAESVQIKCTDPFFHPCVEAKEEGKVLSEIYEHVWYKCAGGGSAHENSNGNVPKRRSTSKKFAAAVIDSLYLMLKNPSVFADFEEKFIVRMNKNAATGREAIHDDNTTSTSSTLTSILSPFPNRVAAALWFRDRGREFGVKRRTQNALLVANWSYDDVDMALTEVIERESGANSPDGTSSQIFSSYADAAGHFSSGGRLSQGILGGVAFRDLRQDLETTLGTTSSAKNSATDEKNTSSKDSVTNDNTARSSGDANGEVSPQSMNIDQLMADMSPAMLEEMKKMGLFTEIEKPKPVESPSPEKKGKTNRIEQKRSSASKVSPAKEQVSTSANKASPTKTSPSSTAEATSESEPAVQDSGASIVANIRKNAAAADVEKAKSNTNTKAASKTKTTLKFDSDDDDDFDFGDEEDDEGVGANFGNAFERHQRKIELARLKAELEEEVGDEVELGKTGEEETRAVEEKVEKEKEQNPEDEIVEAKPKGVGVKEIIEAARANQATESNSPPKPKPLVPAPGKSFAEKGKNFLWTDLLNEEEGKTKKRTVESDPFKDIFKHSDAEAERERIRKEKELEKLKPKPVATGFKSSLARFAAEKKEEEVKEEGSTAAKDVNEGAENEAKETDDANVNDPKETDQTEAVIPVDPDITAKVKSISDRYKQNNPTNTEVLNKAKEEISKAKEGTSADPRLESMNLPGDIIWSGPVPTDPNAYEPTVPSWRTAAGKKADADLKKAEDERKEADEKKTKPPPSEPSGDLDLMKLAQKTLQKRKTANAKTAEQQKAINNTNLPGKLGEVVTETRAGGGGGAKKGKLMEPLLGGAGNSGSDKPKSSKPKADLNSHLQSGDSRVDSLVQMILHPGDFGEDEILPERSSSTGNNSTGNNADEAGAAFSTGFFGEDSNTGGGTSESWRNPAKDSFFKEEAASEEATTTAAGSESEAPTTDNESNQLALTIKAEGEASSVPEGSLSSFNNGFNSNPSIPAKIPTSRPTSALSDNPNASLFSNPNAGDVILSRPGSSMGSRNDNPIIRPGSAVERVDSFLDRMQDIDYGDRGDSFAQKLAFAREKLERSKHSVEDGGVLTGACAPVGAGEVGGIDSLPLRRGKYLGVKYDNAENADNREDVTLGDNLDDLHLGGDSFLGLGLGLETLDGPVGGASKADSDRFASIEARLEAIGNRYEEAGRKYDEV